MIPELGQFALMLALVTALLQASLPLYGSLANVPPWIALARPAARAQLLLVAIAFACLTAAFVSGDFSVAYVANHSNSHLPLLYRISGVWGGHEGSLLLWSLILAVWSGAVAVFTRRLPDVIIARVLSVMAMLSAGFLLFMLLTSNPFTRLFPAPADGRDLNPLLQDIGLAIHPPMLYIGYVGFSVAFAFAIAALIGGRLDAAWARWARPWTNIAWVFLTIGIALGSWWAYYELGWGGWWFWDPVENASFMPWLVGTALIHSLAATEKRGVFKAWTVLLAVFAFSLSLLGAFLVRSGVLTSVHAFATDPARGLFILIFLGVVSGASLILYAWRAPALVGRARFSLVSRETALLINNVFLGALCFAVLTGTLYPLILDALGGGKISVGEPYFNLLFAVIGAPLALSIGVGALLRWKHDRLARLGFKLVAPALASLIIGLLLPLRMEHYSVHAALGIALGCARGPNYDALRGEFVVTRNQRRVVTLHPEKRTYRVQQNPMTEAAIDPGFTRDLYVALGEPLAGGNGAWAVRIYYKPFIRWIWLGALVMALGGLLAATDKRYRRRRAEAREARAGDAVMDTQRAMPLS